MNVPGSNVSVVTRRRVDAGATTVRRGSSIGGAQHSSISGAEIVAVSLGTLLVVGEVGDGVALGHRDAMAARVLTVNGLLIAMPG